MGASFVPELRGIHTSSLIAFLVFRLQYSVLHTPTESFCLLQFNRRRARFNSSHPRSLSNGL